MATQFFECLIGFFTRHHNNHDSFIKQIYRLYSEHLAAKAHFFLNWNCFFLNV